MKFGTINHLSSLVDTWELVEEKNIGSATNSTTFSGLTGNTAEWYLMTLMIINDDASGALYGIRLNNDSGNNYGRQLFRAVGSTKSATQGTSDNQIYLVSNTTTQNYYTFANILIAAKSGYIRTYVMDAAENISGASISGIYRVAGSWNNSADQITSIVVVSDQTSGIGVGSYIALYRKVA